MQKILRFWKSLVYSVENYLRGKVKGLSTPAPRRKNAMIDLVLEEPRLNQFLEKFAGEQGFSVEYTKARIRSYLEEIAADTNYLLMPLFDSCLSWIFNTIYEGIVIDEERLEELKKIAGQKPIVFIPNHRSHVDYLLLSTLFYQHRIPVPFVCGGANLSFWPLGPIFRRGGAFFIRRSFRENELYARTVQAYIEQILKDRGILEFFIEGTRSRTGKLLPPRMGILSSIIKAYEAGAVEDVLLVPVSITYDSVLEEKSYLAEQAGDLKKEEQASDLIKLSRFLKHRAGKVYVKLGETLSLKESLQTLSNETEEKVQSVASQIMHSINRSIVVTPSSMLATAVLSHPKKVITMEEIQNGIEPLMSYLRYKGCTLSEPLYRYRTAAFREAVSNSLKRGALEEIRDDEGIIYLIREEKRLPLSFYKNSSLHFFASLSLFCHQLQRQKDGTLSQETLETDFRFLQTLLRYEFTFSQRAPLQEHLEKIVRFLRGENLIEAEGPLLKIKKGGEKRIAYYASLMESTLEGYAVVWKVLPSLGIRRWHEKELIKWLLHKGNVLYLKEMIRHRESISQFLFKNVLLTFRDLNILEQGKDEFGRKKRNFYRRNREIDRATEENLNHILSHIVNSCG